MTFIVKSEEHDADIHNPPNRAQNAWRRRRNRGCRHWDGNRDPRNVDGETRRHRDRLRRFQRAADHDTMGFGLELANLNAGRVAQEDPSPDDLRCLLISSETDISVDLHPGNTVNAILRGGKKLTFIADGTFNSDDVRGDDIDTLDELVAEMDAENTVVGVPTDQHLALFGTVVPRG